MSSRTETMPLGPLLIGIEGTVLDEATRQRLLSPVVGGVVLFTRNFDSRDQLARLCSELHDLRDPALLITVDQEGGRVQRFRGEMTRLPPLAAPVFRPSAARTACTRSAASSSRRT